MNDYAVVIYFDERTSEELRNLIGKAASYSGNHYLPEYWVPHLALAVKLEKEQ